MTGATRRQKELRKALRVLLPRISMADTDALLDAALKGHLRHLPPSIALWQATTSYIRHQHTDYDVLLEDGYDTDSARFFVVEAMNEKLEEWGCSKQVNTDPEIV